MLSMQLSKRFVQQIVLDGFAFVGILNNLLDCYNVFRGKQCYSCRIAKSLLVGSAPKPLKTRA